jgi:hypothetical protein
LAPPHPLSPFRKFPHHRRRGRTRTAAQDAAGARSRNAASAPGHAKEEGGINVFGYTFLSKLDFGLDLLYGEGQQQLNLDQGLTTFDADSDVTVFGKVKRRF